MDLESETESILKPGPINNENLISDEECYISDEAEDIYNTPIKDNMTEMDDYKVLSGKQWDYLFNIYGGVPIRRFRYKPENYAFCQVDSNFVKLNLTILPPRDDFEMDKIIPRKALYVGINWTFKIGRAHV